MSELIHIDGKPYVLVPMHEYRRLINGDNVAESNIPDEIHDRLAAGTDHPVRLLRRFRQMTQRDLAAAAGLSRPYLAEIETGRKAGSIPALRALATALAVPLALLLPASG